MKLKDCEPHEYSRNKENPNNHIGSIPVGKPI